MMTKRQVARLVDMLFQWDEVKADRARFFAGDGGRYVYGYSREGMAVHILRWCKAEKKRADKRKAAQ